MGVYKIPCEHCGQAYLPSQLTTCTNCGKKLCPTCQSVHKCTRKTPGHLKISLSFPTEESHCQYRNEEPVQVLKARIALLEKTLCERENEIKELKDQLRKKERF